MATPAAVELYSLVVPYLKVKGVLEIFGDEFIVSVHLDSVPAGVGHHDSGHTLGYALDITGHVNFEQSLPINHSVVLVDAVGGAAISHKVLCRGRHLIPIYTYIMMKKLMG